GSISVRLKSDLPGPAGLTRSPTGLTIGPGVPLPVSGLNRQIASVGATRQHHGNCVTRRTSGYVHIREGRSRVELDGLLPVLVEPGQVGLEFLVLLLGVPGLDR